MNSEQHAVSAMSTAFRTDIQALRGYAVLVVVLYHTGIGPFQAGFLGVDIFFVLSGFLITTLIAKGLRQGSFRLVDFYARRAKRLLPAAYVVILGTVLLAPWFVDQAALSDLVWQVIGAVTFTANFVFWSQTDYFAGAADLKLLLHTWSLSVEEQYYLLLPAVLLLVKPSRWLRAICLLLILSLALGMIGALYKPVASFYVLPTRAWELLLGSAGALWLLQFPNGVRVGASALRVLTAPTVLLLVLLSVVRLPGPHPGLAALLACAATLLLILAQHPALNHSVPARFLAWWGDRSYSLYLVHWPVLALMQNAWVGRRGDLPLSLRLGALFLSVALAWLLHRYVEEPVRRREIRWSPAVLVQIGGASALLMIMTPLAVEFTRTETDYRQLRAVNFGLDRSCDFKTPFVQQVACQTQQDPGTLVWGDSYAMHLVPGLASTIGGGLAQATMTACGPFVGLAHQQRVQPERGMIYDRAWAESCLAFNRSVLEYLRNTGSIKTVVLSSVLSPYAGEGDVIHVVQQDGRVAEETSANRSRALDALRHTAQAVRALGKRVVLVAPPPVAAFNIGDCWERLETGRIALGSPAGCAIDAAEYRQRRSNVLAFLDEAEAIGIPVIRFDEALCRTGTCQPHLDGRLLYRDNGHFSLAGSIVVAEHLGLARSIEDRAR